jgi:hypothetical protein
MFENKNAPQRYEKKGILPKKQKYFFSGLNFFPVSASKE